MRRVLGMAILAITIIVLDQVTKQLVQTNFTLGESLPIIDGLFNLTHIRNPGAAFGFLANADASIRKPLFLFIPVIACVWVIWLIWQTRHNNFMLCTAYTLILAGAVGNLIDRFSMGFVVDFLDFYWKSAHFPAFNVADSSITIAAFLLIIDLLLNIKNKSPKASDH
ncbi:MAG: signal peptidase II [Bdellovibrionales bacterium]|jgi:signal peptidase II|nr:signal peptidase II [Bdellovibrionales bacterium]MBT3525313.1 signal peptidase II [Bdellovibrionales bacterium]MBT7766146.1 signal peptidase II [Bdellovibrionales bacterium]